VRTRPARAVLLDELCATTGWDHNLRPQGADSSVPLKIVRPRKSRERAPRYFSDVVAALGFCWAVLGAPTSKRHRSRPSWSHAAPLAPLPDLVLHRGGVGRVVDRERSTAAGRSITSWKRAVERASPALGCRAGAGFLRSAAARPRSLWLTAAGFVPLAGPLSSSVRLCD
jgi:hypothetical protein